MPWFLPEAQSWLRVIHLVRPSLLMFSVQTVCSLRPLWIPARKGDCINCTTSQTFICEVCGIHCHSPSKSRTSLCAHKDPLLRYTPARTCPRNRMHQISGEGDPEISASCANVLNGPDPGSVSAFSARCCARD